MKLSLLCLFIIVTFTFASSKKQNVLFIIIDDLRPALGCYGENNAYTPNIDGLARRSFVFQNVYAQQALCAPSRNSFLTSRRPDTLHLYDFYNYWRDFVGNFTTLPQHFRENGYYTKSIGKVFHPGISSNYTDDSEYSWSDKPFHPKTEKYKEAKVCLNSDGTLARNLICPVVVEEQPGGTLPDLESYEAAADFLDHWESITDGSPFFLAVGFHKPHIPLKYPMEYLKYHHLENISLPENRWRPSLMPVVAWNHWYDVRSRQDMKKLNVSFPFGSMPDDVIKKVIQSYKAATTYIDDLIGKLLALVDDDTLIVLTGDHGWSLSEHGEFSKYSNFDIATRVPLILHVPGLSTEGILIHELGELVDIFPTLVDLTQVSPPLSTCPKINGNNVKLCTEGKSLVSAMFGAVTKKESFSSKTAVFTQYPRSGSYPSLHPNSDKPHLKQIKIMGYSIRTDRYRYCEWVKFNHTTFKPDWSLTYGIELYDHSIDPDENENLSDRDEMKYIMKHLRRRLVLGWRHA